MANVFIDNIIEFNQYDINLDEDIFESILAKRKGEFDSQRFFLKYIAEAELSKYDFNNPDSLAQFRNVSKSPLKGMGGCNLIPDMLQQDIRYAGIKLSDPDKNIVGQFDIRNHIVTYSPIFLFFYEDRDITKFANDEYFTPLTFEELIANQINHANKYFVHVGNYKKPSDIVKYGNYILEEVSKSQMLEFASNPELGSKILTKHLKI